jgi:hypothetical protein
MEEMTVTASGYDFSAVHAAMRRYVDREILVRVQEVGLSSGWLCPQRGRRVKGPRVQVRNERLAAGNAGDVKTVQKDKRTNIRMSSKRLGSSADYRGAPSSGSHFNLSLQGR